jgi:hypothetical protein
MPVREEVTDALIALIPEDGSRISNGSQGRGSSESPPPASAPPEPGDPSRGFHGWVAHHFDRLTGHALSKDSAAVGNWLTHKRGGGSASS